MLSRRKISFIPLGYQDWHGLKMMTWQKYTHKHKNLGYANKHDVKVCHTVSFDEWPM